MVAAWIGVPVLCAAIAAGLGELVARAAGRRLGSLALPAGFAAGAVLVTVLLEAGTTGRVAAAATAIAALPGLLLLLRRPRRRPAGDTWLIAGAAVGAYVAGMLPVVMSGRVAVLGYVLNNDSAIHLSAIELIKHYGTSLPVLPQSSYASVSNLIGTGYPLGGYAWPLIGSCLTSIDTFTIWTPILALYSALLALVSHAALSAAGVRSRWAAVLGALVASGYLIYAFLDQGGLKETATALSIYATVILLFGPADGGVLRRRALPALVTSAGAVCVFGLAAAAWLAPVGVAMLLALAWGSRGRPLPRARTLLLIGAAVALGVVVAVPFIRHSIDFVNASEQTLRNPAQAGNLLGAVPWHESLNIWFAGDYRIQPPDNHTLTALGWRFALSFAVVGLAWALVHRHWVLLVAIFAGAVGTDVVTQRYSIYLDAKALVLIAPAQGLLTALGIWAVGTRWAPARLVMTAVFALGIAGSAFYVYRDAWLTPGPRFAEMHAIDRRFAGRGPILVNEREEYSIYLLRDVTPWQSWGSYQPERGFAAGEVFPEALPHTPDFDDYRTDFVQQFPLLLERRRPGGSRPPSNYRPILQTPHYRVWERTAAPAPITHLGLGTDDPRGEGVVDCRRPEVSSLLRTAQSQHADLLLGATAPPVITTSRARDWSAYAGSPIPPPTGMITRRRGTSLRVLRLPPGRYATWIQGSFGPGARLYVDGHLVGRVHDDLGLPDAWQTFGDVRITRPRTTVLLVGAVDRRLKPGSAHVDINGSTVFERDEPRGRPRPVAAAHAGAICGRSADWVEVVPHR